ncbi:MAG: GNAT family N-acetyltransferase [Ktedonobacterales bacterium]
MGMLTDIRTPRLWLYGPTWMEVEALRRGERDELAARLNAVVSLDWWRGPSLLRLLRDLPRVMREEPGETPWIWMIIDTRARRVIGDLGFHRPIRDAETVEIGWSVIPEARGYGYTPEAATAVIGETFVRARVNQVIAQIEATNSPSLRVAAKLGMVEQPPVTAGSRRFGISREDASALMDHRASSASG